MSGRFAQSAWMMPSGNANDGISPPGAGNPQYFDGTLALAAAMTTVPVPVRDLDGFSIHFATPAGSTLVGTLTLQVSSQRGNTEQTGAPDVTLTDWTTIDFFDPTTATTTTFVASKAVASGAQSLILALPYGFCLYRWARLAFAFTSGTGKPKIAFQQKGCA